MGSVTIDLPWPPRDLQPHAKGLWYKKANATKVYRSQAFWWAKKAKLATDPGATLRFTYHPPDNRRRDCQNVPSMLKPAIDGIADAMKCDDNGFAVHYPARFSHVVRGGKIVCELTYSDVVEIPLIGRIT